MPLRAARGGIDSKRTIRWLWRYALHARLVRPDAGDDEIILLTHRLTPGLGAYVLLIIIGTVAPVVAVIGYLVIAIFFLLPLRVHRRQRPRS